MTGGGGGTGERGVLPFRLTPPEKARAEARRVWRLGMYMLRRREDGGESMGCEGFI